MIVSIRMTSKEHQALSEAIAAGKLKDLGLPTVQIVSPDDLRDAKGRWTVWEADRSETKNKLKSDRAMD